MPRKPLTNRDYANAAAQSRCSIYIPYVGNTRENAWSTAKEEIRAREKHYQSLDASSS
jgi:hypothetical protein